MQGWLREHATDQGLGSSSEHLLVRRICWPTRRFTRRPQPRHRNLIACYLFDAWAHRGGHIPSPNARPDQVVGTWSNGRELCGLLPGPRASVRSAMPTSVAVGDRHHFREVSHPYSAAFHLHFSSTPQLSAAGTSLRCLWPAIQRGVDLRPLAQTATSEPGLRASFKPLRAPHSRG